MPMTSAPSPTPASRSLLTPFVVRPRLSSSAALGIVLFALLFLVAGGLPWTQRAVLSWDATCLCFVGLVMQEMAAESIPVIKRLVARQDEGQGMILGLVLVAVVVSLVAVGVELSDAKDEHGFGKALRIGTAGLTVALSWIMVQVTFALHYAHQYYAPDLSTEEADDVMGGLAFPGGAEPDYWDFFHFAVVVGVACQTADIAFTNRRLRHIGTVHGLIAFTFNTLVLALAINLLAGLF